MRAPLPFGFRRGLPIALLILVVDQISKWWVLEVLRLPERGSVPLLDLPPFGLDLTMVWNRGVTFGLLSGSGGWHHVVLALLAILIAAFLLRWMARAETGLVAVALGGVVGGAAGNAIDRLRFGAVVDFVDAHVTFGEGTWHWYVFNLADAAIVCGVVALIADALFRTNPGVREGT
ncbi:signal peptidase II [Roseomonas sp. NAR14]|uniref:Lipoprotein signal peptidase n=1 Tax=Roseomonas acroporae TaxID=2937791 RepID=A0A9X2BU57_9PROT|nr:signal peptidase II [Roseomonas acroporae]MCK8785112.1 signal peptidase II [Roseomonas acroporae]